MSDEKRMILLADIVAIAAEVASTLVSEPVEPQGILSRIENHLVSLRDYLHGALQDPVPPDGVTALHLLRAEVRSIADHDAQIGAARHEFLRDYLVSAHSSLVSKLDNLTEEWRAGHGRVMAKLDLFQTELEKQSSRAGHGRGCA